MEVIFKEIGKTKKVLVWDVVVEKGNSFTDFPFPNPMETKKASFQPDTDVHITFEDQQRINNFARHNARLDELKEDLKNKQNKLRNFEDAVDELELMDDSELIPFLVGEVFIYQDPDNTKKSIEELKERTLAQIKQIEKQSEEMADVMSKLKTQLYAKFGNHINLEPEED